MARFYLFNRAEVIVLKFDALTLLEARQAMRARCLDDVASYRLAVVIRQGDLLTSDPIRTVADTEAAIAV